MSNSGEDEVFKAPKSDLYDKAVWTLTGSAALISFTSTLTGVAAQVADKVGWPMALLAGVLASALLSGMIFVFWSSIFARRVSGFFIPVALIAGIAAIGISTSFAAGGIKTAFMKDELQSRLDYKSISPVIRSLQKISGQSAASASLARNFAIRSSNLAGNETKFGNTCEGPPVGAKCGPRCRMRNRLAGEAKDMSKKAESLAKDVSGLVVNAAAVKTDAQWNAVNLRASELKTDPRPMEINLWAEQSRDDFRNEFIDAQEGAFVCRDRDSAKKLEEIAAKFDDDLKFDLPPRRPDAGFAQAASETIGVVLSPATGFFGIEYDIDPQAVEASRIPIIIALLADIVTVILLYLALEHRRDLRVLQAIKGHKMEDHERRGLAALTEAFNIGYVPEDSGDDFFLQILSAHDKKHVARAQWFVNSFDLTPHARRGEVQLSATFPEYHERLKRKVDGVDMVRIWKIPRRSMAKIKRLISLHSPMTSS